MCSLLRGHLLAMILWYYEYVDSFLVSFDRRGLQEAVARAASAQGEFARADPTLTATLLDTAARELEGTPGLVAIADDETGLGVSRLEGELARTTSQLRAFADFVRGGEDLDVVIEHLPQGAPARELRRLNRPVGPVAVYAASNFPLAFGVAGGDTAAAWAARCPVVAKVHPAQPLTSGKIATALERAVRAVGLPSGVFGAVRADDPELSRQLVRLPGIRAVGFTGSTAGGLALMAAAADRPIPIPVFAEMGSLNPVVVAPSALGPRLETTAGLLASSALLGSGQFCTKPGVILVQSSDAVSLHQMVCRMMADAPQVARLLSPHIKAGFDGRVMDTRGLSGVELWQDERPVTDESSPAALALVSMATFEAEPALREEHFGPFAVVVGVDSPSDVERLLGLLGGNLTGTVMGDAADSWVQTALQIMPEHVGRVLVNAMPTGVAVNRAQVHGGPFPASSNAAHTSIGLGAAARFQRPVVYQDTPDELLPPALQQDNPWHISRLIDGVRSTH